MLPFDLPVELAKPDMIEATPEVLGVAGGLQDNEAVPILWRRYCGFSRSTSALGMSKDFTVIGAVSKAAYRWAGSRIHRLISHFSPEVGPSPVWRV